MSNNKQSSVEWLISQLTEVDYNCINKTFLQSNNSLAGHKMREIFEQAKAMHKEECIKYYVDSVDYGDMGQHIRESLIQIAEKMYNETYGGDEQ